ncbi:hypothetical protein PHMEG_00025016 [Phytophthora megakarya]|uniref:Uncharacterized protein n=1 Tax=Phytophthora megakarya TaxID=4795 RepID=A0A225VDS9_9STRA|nr:hypothetical protein PHMEG_00025016 [Phytophthora megakarya]
MDAFIEHVLGVTLKQMKNKPFDGLFGDGDGSLHAHFLVWIYDAPPNTDAFRRAVTEHGDLFYRDIAMYTDSIVNTSIPLDVEALSCQWCGHSFANL